MSEAAKSLQSCLTLCDPIDGSPPGSPVPGILQARTLEWVAISFSNAWKWKGKVKSLSRVWLLATPWTAAYQAPPSMDFPGKSTGVGCHCLLREWVHRYPNQGADWNSSFPLLICHPKIITTNYCWKEFKHLPTDKWANRSGTSIQWNIIPL